MYGEKKDVSDHLAFGCRFWVYLDKQNQEKGKHMPKANEAIYQLMQLAFETCPMALQFQIEARGIKLSAI